MELELKADKEVETALGVSCFSVEPMGLKVMEAEPIPVTTSVKEKVKDDGEDYQIGKSMIYSLILIKTSTTPLDLVLMITSWKVRSLIYKIY